MNPYSEKISFTFQDAHGELPYNMTNDYMFRAVLQANNKVLQGLICSLLHLAREEVVSVEITNPIVLGDAVTDKEFRLDINVVLNNNTLINLEMQIANRLNWRERSVMYLCRSFDQLNHGQDYGEARSVIHIGFLDYTLFEEYPEFYATYKLINVKNYQKYSDSITLHVVDLSHIELATAEDKQYHIHEWAELFKATTWEEIKMLASKDEYLGEAAQTIYRMSADEMVRKRCRDREEYYQDLRNYEKKIERDRLEHEQDLRNYEKKIERDRLEYEQDLQNYERVIAQNKEKHEQDLQNYKRVIAQNKEKHEQDLQNYERVIAQNKEKHEQDLQNYERVIAQNEEKYEQDLQNYERVIAQNKEKHEQDLRNYERVIAEQSQQIALLRAEIEQLKKQL